MKDRKAKSEREQFLEMLAKDLESLEPDEQTSKEEIHDAASFVRKRKRSGKKKTSEDS